MTVQTAVHKARFIGDGVNTTFPFAFKTYQTTDLQLTQTSLAGVDTSVASLFSIVLNTDQEGSPGGTITYPTSGAPMGAGVVLTVTGVLAETQLTDLTNAGGFFPKTISDRFDYITILIQQHAEKLARALFGSVSDIAPNFSLGTAAQRALKYLTFDASGNVSLAQALPSGTLSAASIGSFLYPQTAAEVSVGVAPTTFLYAEGDIRRYGATTGASTNHTAINTALKVSGAGGAAAFIPGGSWNITTSCKVLANASIYGVGNGSIIKANGCDGLLFGQGTNYAVAGVSQFIRDFQIVGNNLTTSTNTGLACDMSAAVVGATLTVAPSAGATTANMTVVWPKATGTATFQFSDGEVRRCTVTNGSVALSWVGGLDSAVTTAVSYGGRVTGVNLANLTILNFQTGMFLRGAWNFSFDNVTTYNTFYGIAFYGQTINAYIFSCFFQAATQTVADSRLETTSTGLCWETIDGESTQGTHIWGTQSYAWNKGYVLRLAFETQIEHCDISNNQSIGVDIISTQGGAWVRDCWIETNGASATVGVKVENIASLNYQDVHVLGNHIIADQAFAGSTGIFIGSAQYAVTANDNHISGFDIGVSNLAAPNLVCKFNRINVLTTAYSASSAAVSLNSLSNDNEIGPNALVPGNALTLPAFFSAATMANASANIGVAVGTTMPAGTPVQFDAAVNGVFTGVTYYSLGITANVLTVAATPGGAAIVMTGNTAVNVLATPLPVVFNAGTPAGIALYARGSFIGSLTGFTAAVSGPVDWVASGRSVLVNVRSATNLSGTSNATTMTMTGLPGFLNPITTQQFLATTNDATAGFTYGWATLTAGGVFSFFKTPNAGAFTNTGTKGVNTLPMAYLLT